MREALRWAGSFAFVVALHAGAIRIALGWVHGEVPYSPPPLPAAPEATPTEAPPGPELSEVIPEPEPPPPVEMPPPVMAEVTLPDPEPPSPLDLKPPPPPKPIERKVEKKPPQPKVSAPQDAPEQAQRARHKGVAYVRFVMSRDGRVLSARIERPSGFASLDQEGLELLQRAQPLPSLPQDQPGESLEIVVPVQFFLKR